MGSKRREVIDGKIRCGSSRHDGERMRDLDEFCKSKTPDGLSYSCKSCRSKENKELNGSRYTRWKRKSPLKALFYGRKADANKRGLLFDITIDDIAIPDLCPVLGIPILTEGGPRTNNSPSIDRIDNTKGYTKDNVVVISWRANLLKKDASIEELCRIAEFYTSHLEKQ